MTLRMCGRSMIREGDKEERRGSVEKFYNSCSAGAFPAGKTAICFGLLHSSGAGEPPCCGAGGVPVSRRALAGQVLGILDLFTGPGSRRPDDTCSLNRVPGGAPKVLIGIANILNGTADREGGDGRAKASQRAAFA
jgi:hypothetical protein